MHRTAVQSSNLAEIAWANETLYCQFKKGTWYSYAGVPFDLYSEFARAESVGQFFHQRIKPAYVGVELDAAQVDMIRTGLPAV